MAANDDILDLITDRGLDLQRLTAGQMRDSMAFLAELEADLVAQIARIDPTGVGNASYQAKRLANLLQQVKATIASAYRAEAVRMAGELKELAALEASFAATSVNSAVGVTIMNGGMTRGQLAALADGVLVQGAPVSDWWSRQAGDTLQRFTDEMRLGIAQGETAGQLMRRVRGGTKAGEVVAGIMDASRNHARSLVRSATQAVSQKARQGTYEANDDILKGVAWVSTLDMRTTVGCAARDGLLYTVVGHKPIGHDLGWDGGPGQRHWGCRSTSTPVTKSWRDLGFDIDDLPPGKRASMDGQVPSDTSFEGWLGKRSKKEQDEYLGPGRADLWRNGDLTFRELLDASGRELTLEQLRRKA